MAPASPPGSWNFTVGWICALLVEYIAALQVLDETYEDHPDALQAKGDYNVYTRGRIGKHHVVVVCLPANSYGLVSASRVIASMRSSFPSIRFAVMVGIAGGSPDAGNDVRLGDVVVGTRVIPYLFGKQTPSGHEYTGHVLYPPDILLYRANDMQHRTMVQLNMEEIIEDKIGRMSSRIKRKFQRPEQTSDRLYLSDYVHHEGCDCSRASSQLSDRLVNREPRVQGSRVLVHSGAIASGDQVIKDARTRDNHAQRLGTLCFDMESAALTNIDAIGIRGICDYADSHKNDQWHGYAAIAAAVCAVEFLKLIPVSDVQDSQFNMAEEEVRRFVAASVEEVRGAVDATLTMANQQAAIPNIKSTLAGIEDRFALLDRLEKSVMTNKGEDDLTAKHLRNLEESHGQLQAALNDLSETTLRQRDESSSPETRQTWSSMHTSITDKLERFRRGAASISNALSVTGNLGDIGNYAGNEDVGFAGDM
ncbi:purine and uridine phosphorylase, partial [Aspergillus ibericus CBS 121593]